MTIRIYTDGSCKPNPGPGGWGAVVLRKGEPPEELSGRARDTTNNRMELAAALEALKRQDEGVTVEMYTDSMYLRDGITKWIRKWRVKGYRTRDGDPVTNSDLWRALDVEIGRRNVQWNWVKAHDGDRWNERADALARGHIGTVEPASEETAPVHAFLGTAWSGATRRGAVGVVLSYGEHRKELSDGFDDVESANRVHLLSAIHALRALKRSVPIHLHTTSDYLAGGAGSWIEGWKRRGWRTSAGEAVKHRELWEELEALLGGQPVEFRVVPREQRDGEMTAAKDLASLAAKQPERRES